MTAALEGNLDYILFVYGLGFVLLAITLLGLRATVTSPLPWKWLGLSALFLGLNQYKGRGNDRQFILSAWSCVSQTIDRKSDHKRRGGPESDASAPSHPVRSPGSMPQGERPASARPTAFADVNAAMDAAAQALPDADAIAAGKEENPQG